MTHSQFPWSEGVSYVFDANDKVVCREPLLPELEGGHWNDDRKLIAALPAMIEALEPFANIAPLVEFTDFRDGEVVHRQLDRSGKRHELTKQDFRNAAAVLTSIGRTK